MGILRMRKSIGWYAIFAFLLVGAFVTIYLLTGVEALGVAGGVIGRAITAIGNSFFRIAGSLLQMLTRGIGLRRLSRVAAMVGGVGAGYAASVVMSDGTVSKARDWRGRLRTAAKRARVRWQRSPLLVKLAVVGVLVASQVYLHFVLILFPIAFLIPVVRRLGIGIADRVFGAWYWKTFGSAHRAGVIRLRTLAGVRHVIGAVRLTRLRYLSAWRLWRHDPQYRDPLTNRRQRSLREPLRLWWHGKLDGYVGRPLLSGGRQKEGVMAHASRVKPVQFSTPPTANTGVDNAGAPRRPVVRNMAAPQADRDGGTASV